MLGHSLMLLQSNDEESTMNIEKLDELKNKFYEDPTNESYKALKDAYKQHFGDMYLDVLHVMFEHMGAELYDWLYEEKYTNN